MKKECVVCKVIIYIYIYISSCKLNDINAISWYRAGIWKMKVLSQRIKGGTCLLLEEEENESHIT